mgnify:FL=1
MKRAWFIGTGPSLRDVDLTRLEGELTYACNRIHRHSSWRAGWRPSVYLGTDRSRNPAFDDDLRLHLAQGQPVVSVVEILQQPEQWAAAYPNLRLLARCEHAHAEHRPATAWHLPGICTFAGPIYQAAQLAVLEQGADELVFLGCDLGYRATENGHDPNHFAPDYSPGIYPAEYAFHELRNETLRQAHRIVALECAARGVRVINAGAGGQLEEHERVNLEALL